MTTVLFFHMVNCAIRAVLTCVILPMLLMFPDQFKPSQRLGLALVASGSLMTVPILYMGEGVSPFDGWATTLLTIGLILFMWTTVVRLFRHHLANMQQLRYYDRRNKGEVE